MEAGAEAIMPLERINGSLGVKSTPAKVTLNIENNTSQAIDIGDVSESFKTNERGEEERVINIILKHAKTNLGFKTTMKGMLNG